MPVTVFAAGALRPLKAESVMISGTLRKLKTVKVMRGGILVTVAVYTGSAITAAASPNAVSGSRTNNRSTRVVSAPVTVSIDGGAGPYTYNWITLPSDQMVIDSPSSPTTTFSATLFDSTVSATGRCTVSDGYGHSATCDVAVTLTHFYSGDPTGYR